MAALAAVLFAALLAALWLPPGPAAASPALPGMDRPDEATLILVRHGETDDPEDPDRALSPAGEERARALAALLRDAGVTRVLSTGFRRTVGTAAPLAQQSDLAVERYDHRTLAELADTLRNARGVVLVVGHSNTTPELVGHLGGDPGSPIHEDEHDRLYLVHAGAEGEPTRVLLLRYGVPYRSD